jgi:asparagine synthase (glutamine-hydrolysing)
MCGIAGFTPVIGDRSTSISIMKEMLLCLTHRGPDDRAIFVDDASTLGHVRLSIIDIDSGQQPMSDEEGIYWIVFNGEIFNYVELRRELESGGYRFRTKSDTEVLLYLYIEYGAAALEKLNGQFAFAVWNTRERSLFLARDRVGIRPLFYVRRGDALFFASEIKALLQIPGINAQLSGKALLQTFTLWTTISPYTAFEDVYEVPPGHYMLFREGVLSIKRYWQLLFPEAGAETSFSLQDNSEKFSALFRDAVRIRLRSDVPVGAYLSGGIDSSVTTATIREVFPDILRTFSIGFSEEGFDESEYQQLVIDHLKVDNAGVMCASDEIAKIFPEVVRHAEAPLLRTAPAPMYILSAHVKKHGYKVVLTGEGADELLAGYNIFKEMRIRRFWSKYPSSRLRPLLLKKLYPYLEQLSGLSNNALSLFFGYQLSNTNSPLYSHLLRWHNTSRIGNFMHVEFKNAFERYDPREELTQKLPQGFDRWDPLAQAQWLETSLFMSNYLLSAQGDRMAMANSVEGRYPFLDHRLIEFCAKIHPDHKLHGFNEKFLLKQAMRGKLPPQIVDRSKQAYRAPVKSALLSGNNEVVQEMLSVNRVREAGLFDVEKVAVMLNALHGARKTSEIDHMALTAVVSTQLLYDQFVRAGYKKHPGGNELPFRLISEDRYTSSSVQYQSQYIY